MTFVIDNKKIVIPQAAADDYLETMKLGLDKDCVSVYVEAALIQNPDLNDDTAISRTAIEMMYHEISGYTTFPGRHYKK